MAPPLEDVYCTLLMSDSYLPGAAVLAHSLRDAGTTKKLAVLITLDTLSTDTITQLKGLYDYLIPVDRIRTPRPANLYLMGRPDLSFTFTKIALWKQMQFRKIVYLDADIVALRALDELFAIEAPFAAAPDIGWPDAFNSGVMVITPSMGEYWALQTMAAAGESFDGADQGLLNQYFEHRPWQRLKFTYNCTPNAEYQWEPAYRYYKRDISAVHFIGKEKPWTGSRSTGHGVYGELLARWWAVHDRHLKQATDSDLQHVHDISIKQHVPEIIIEPATMEPSMTDPGEQAEELDQGHVEPTPTAEQRKFSAPEMEWDATRFEPPAKSKPEAANFPSATYTFSDSHQLFKAPASYPEPPKDMWYKVPESKPELTETPKAIFPWERDANRPKATRVFAEDLPSSPTPTAPVPAVESPIHSFSTVHYQDDREKPNPQRVSSPKSADEQWQAFQQSSGNAWDSVPGIDTYVRAIMDSQARRGSVQVLQQVTGTEDIGSPTLQRKNRRESLILTDFPSAIERPSLPVTPAPVRRPTFWGEERDSVSELPTAEGVPEQPDWNPGAKLEHLRRSSLVEIEHLKNDEHPNPPLRALPEHSVLTDENANTGATRTWDDWTSKKPAQKKAGPSAKTRGNKTGFTMSDFGTKFGKEEKTKQKNSWGHTSSSVQDFAEHGFDSTTSQRASSQQNFSSFTSQHSSSTQEHTSLEHSITAEQIPGGRIRAGETVFTLPSFSGGKIELASPVDGELSPTTSRDEKRESQHSF